MKSKLFFLAVAILGMVNTNNAQHKCISQDLYKQHLLQNPALAQYAQNAEVQTQHYVSKNIFDKHRKTRAIRYIPTVVHIIHRGEAIGTGSNISDAQVISQITALNKDFRLLNTDSLLPSHPFWNYTADCEIQFCLALRKVDGSPTNGINRVNMNGPVNGWDENGVDNTIKPTITWDDTKYLNIWVVKFDPSLGLLGYATFPGMSGQGLVINYTNFGTVGAVIAPYNKGRTATHEIGHYLNLYHIWGDDDNDDGVCQANECSGDDYVSDTPLQCEANYGCPNFPSVTCNNGVNGDMYMNYMDYSDDNCMNMFTFGQKARMLATLTNSRSTLLDATNKSCNWPTSTKDIFNTENNILISPNIVQQSFYINNNTASKINSIEIINTFGQSIKTIRNVYLQNNYSFDISEIACGTYFVKINLDNHVVCTKKITKL